MKAINVASMEAYSYSALSSERHIRIIILHPAQDFGDILRCDLEQLEIEESIQPGREYHAVSYCWGEPNFSSDLLCENALLKITPNVESLLRHLRKTHKVHRLWVDGICINQQDSEEKSRQLILMGQIFFCAARLHIWLGEELPSDLQAFTLLRKLSLLIRPYDPKGTSRHGWDELRAREHLSIISTLALLKRPWFSRRWVLQEIALSHDTILHCGLLCINLAFFVEGLQILQKIVLGASECDELNENLTVALRTLQCSRKSGRGILELLIDHRDSACSDGRDRIFALLSLARDSWLRQCPAEPSFDLDLDPDLDFYSRNESIADVSQPRFVPSYLASIQEVYTDFARCCIARGYYMQVTCLAACFPCEGAPSWVPDWRLSGVCRALRPTQQIVFGAKDSIWAQVPEHFENRNGQLHRTQLGSGNVVILNNDGPFEKYTRCAVRDLLWLGGPLPISCSREDIKKVLRHWLSFFIVEDPLGCSLRSRRKWISTSRNPIAFKWPWHRYNSSIERMLASIDNSGDAHRRAVQNAAFSQTVLYNAVQMGPPNTQRVSIKGAADQYTMLFRSSAKDCFLETEDKVFVKATALGIEKPGYISLFVLPKFFRTILCDWDEPVNGPDSYDWFPLRDQRRAGFMELLTSDQEGITHGLEPWWKLLATWQVARPSEDYKDRNVEAFCSDLRRMAGGRPFAVVKQRYEISDYLRDYDLSGIFEVESGPIDERDMILGAPGTQSGDKFLTWKVGHLAEIKDPYSGVTYNHGFHTRSRISLLLTPSNSDANVQHTLRRKLKDGSEKSFRERGYRIRGDGWMLPSSNPETGNRPPIVIDA